MKLRSRKRKPAREQSCACAMPDQTLGLWPDQRFFTFCTSVIIGLSGLVAALICDLRPAAAQSGFDSGSLLRQIERSLPMPVLPSIGPAEPLPSIALLQGKGERMHVRKFIVSGNHLIPTDLLQEALGPY